MSGNGRKEGTPWNRCRRRRTTLWWSHESFSVPRSARRPRPANFFDIPSSSKGGWFPRCSVEIQRGMGTTNQTFSFPREREPNACAPLRRIPARLGSKGENARASTWARRSGGGGGNSRGTTVPDWRRMPTTIFLQLVRLFVRSGPFPVTRLVSSLLVVHSLSSSPFCSAYSQWLLEAPRTTFKSSC